MDSWNTLHEPLSQLISHVLDEHDRLARRWHVEGAAHFQESRSAGKMTTSNLPEPITTTSGVDSVLFDQESDTTISGGCCTPNGSIFVCRKPREPYFLE